MSAPDKDDKPLSIVMEVTKTENLRPFAEPKPA